MEDIYALLNINKGLIQDFPLQAERLVDHQTELAINRDMRALKEYEVRMMSDNGVRASIQTIDEIIQKVIDNAGKRNSDDSAFGIRELRIISYYLMKLQGNDSAYEYALGLLDRNWRDMFFNGLSFYCLDTWNLIDPPLRVRTCELLRNKLQQYKGGNKKYMALKNHANLFEEAGPKRLAALLTQRKQDVIDAPSYFSNRPSSIAQSFYSDVIVSYCESNRIMDLEKIKSILEAHNSDRTKKLVLADLVIRMDGHGDDLQRSMLCKFVSRTLGDITLNSTWAPFSGATEKDAQKLKKAKQLVNLWFNQKIIETFFEVCVQDRDRKEFWLKYVDRLTGFRIVGSTATKRLLQLDQRVSGIFLPYYIETDSHTAQTSALVLFIKNKMLVEFSDTGALYAYGHQHSMVTLVTKNRHKISSTADLKIPSMANLVFTNDWGEVYYHTEGRMTHQGYWQERLTGWLDQMVLSADSTGITFFDSDDEKVFTAKPVDKIEFKPSPSPQVTELFLFDDGPSGNGRSSQANRKEEQNHDLPEPTIATYETGVRYDIASKWFFQDKCRVVASSNGFYLHINRGQKYVRIKNIKNGSRAYGNIWVKKPDDNGWSAIVHFSMGAEIPVGYIKESGDKLLFRRDLSVADMMRIKL